MSNQRLEMHHILCHLCPMPITRWILLFRQIRLSFHYGKHHKTYVDNLNKLIAGTELADMSLEEVIAATAGKADKAEFSIMRRKSGTIHSTGTACRRKEAASLPRH